jgi:outer membrane protein W
MRRFVLTAILVGFIATPAFAQQSLNFFVGGFTPRAEDARTPNDVLVNDLTVSPQLSFNISDFNSAVFGAEYLAGLGDKFEAGLGIGFQQRSVPSVYDQLINSDGSEIEQTLKLRDIPFTATVRFLPLGHQSGVQPFIGGGVGIHAWRYSESGQFVDTSNAIFRNTYVASGTATGPVVLGGVRFAADTWGVGGELRWQSAIGNLPPDSGFVTDRSIDNQPKIDLGGFTYLFSVSFRF